MERAFRKRKRLSSILRWQHPLKLRTPNGTGAEAPLKSANGSRANRRWEVREDAEARLPLVGDAQGKISKTFPVKDGDGLPQRLPLVGDDRIAAHSLAKLVVDMSSLLMEAVTVRERFLAFFSDVSQAVQFERKLFERHKSNRGCLRA